jgi:ribosomal protein S18 acetylase RimI-like enzyme
MSDPCQFLEWDSHFFGFAVGQVLPVRIDSHSLELIMAWAESRKIRCLYCLRSIDDLDAAALLAERGFRVADIRVTLDIDLTGRKPAEHPDSGFGLRTADPSDLPALLDIAQTCHVQSRFFSDKGFPRERCGELYRHWIRRDLADPAATVLAAGPPGRPVGYMSYRLDSPEEASMRLMGVAGEARERGLGARLMGAALDQAHNQGRRRATVVTQGSNMGAQRLFQKLGFRTSRMEMWFHRWFPRPLDPG